MDNNRLSREVDTLKSNVEDVLSTLVSEVEEWEGKYNEEVLKNEDLEQKLFESEERVRELEGEVEDLNQQIAGDDL